MRLNLSIKGVLRILLAGVVATASVVLVRMHNAGMRSAQGAVEARALDIATTTRVKIRQLLDDAETVVGELALEGEGVLSGRTACGPYYSIEPELAPRYTNAILLDAEGSVVCTMLPREGGTATYADRDWFREAATSVGLITSVPLRGLQSDTWSMAIARSVFAEDGARLGVAAVGIDLVHLQQLVEAPELPEGSRITLARDSTLILARSVDPELWIGRQILGDRTPAEALGEGRGRTRAETSEGVPSFFTFETVPGVDWRVYVGIPEDEVTGPVYQWLLRETTVLLAGILIVTLIALFGYRWIGDAVDDLLRRARTAVEDRSAFVDPHGPAELRQISSEFQRTLSALSEVEEETAKLSRAVTQIADPVMITNVNGVIEYVNPSFESITGWSASSLRGKTPRVLNSGTHESAFFAELWATILAGRPFRGRLTNVRKDGTRYIEDRTITPIRDTSGAITHFVATGKDITEQEELQARLS